MTVVRVRGFKIFRDRHGKLRCYHRSSKVPIDLVKAPLGSAAFLAECQRITAPIAAVEPKPGTLGLLIAAYRNHSAFRDLAPRTRADYAKAFDYLSPIGNTPLQRFDKPLVVRIRDKAADIRGRKFANDLKARFSGLFGWGAERGFISSNVAAGIKDIRRDRNLPDANRPWSDSERQAVLAACPPHMLPALGIMMFTGLGPADTLKLPKNAYKQNEIATRRAKTGEPVYWPCPSPLVAILDNSPPHDAITLCANSRGRPWTLNGFQAVWDRLKKRLQADGLIGPALTLYGLRHTVAVILREIGYDERAIADALGQKTIEMARRYAKGADLKPKMTGIVTRFDEELNRRNTKTVKPTG